MQYTEIKEGMKAIVNEYDNEIHIAMIVVDESYRCKGIGTKYILETIEYAKRYNKIVTLIPSDIYGGNLRRLKKFYKRLGFKQISHKWCYFS